MKCGLTHLKKICLEKIELIAMKEKCDSPNSFVFLSGFHMVLTFKVLNAYCIVFLFIVNW
jgi:hypothetical protein